MHLFVCLCLLQGPTPQVFAPGVISGPASDLSPAFTPDGKTVFFTRANAGQSVILMSHLVGGRWASPVIAPFSGEWRDLEPTMAPSGAYLVFASNRPASPGGTALDAFYNGGRQPGIGGNLWRVDRTAKGWGTPSRLPDIVNSNSSVFSPSIAADGSLYFMQPTGAAARFHLFRAQFSGGAYSAPVALPFSAIPDTGDFDPAVAPDESFVVFSSARSRRGLFITFRTGSTWSVPVYLGDSVSQPGAIEARLSPDHRTLFFSSTRVIPPRAHPTRAEAREALRQMAEWNNGLNNIWQVPLGYWLDGQHPEALVPLSAGPVALASAPQIIGPGVISTPAEEFKATLSPDGQVLLYVVADHRFRHMTIVESQRADTGWGPPRVVSFSGIWRDGDPAFAPNGDRVFFISNRPLSGDVPQRNYNIWSTRRGGNGAWNSPEPLGPEINTDTSDFAPSVDGSGALYFSRGEHILRAAPMGARFAAPVPLPFRGGDPAIAPDGNTLIFDGDGGSPGDGDLFVACRTVAGWTAPRSFASPVNSPQEEGDPSLAADGRTMLFFSRRYTPAPDRAPRPRPANYEEVEREAVTDPYNGSRNLFQVMLTPLPCPAIVPGLPPSNRKPQRASRPQTLPAKRSPAD